MKEFKRKSSNSPNKKETKNVQKPNSEAEAYKQENRLLKNRLKSLIAIKEVHHLNKFSTMTNQILTTGDEMTGLDLHIEFENGMKKDTLDLDKITPKKVPGVAYSSPLEIMTPSYNSGYMFKTEDASENLNPNPNENFHKKIEMLKFELKKLKDERFTHDRELELSRKLNTSLEIQKFITGCELLRLAKNNASIKRQMQGMEDTINTLKLENKVLKESHEKLQT
jgi:hypothetical protein